MKTRKYLVLSIFYFLINPFIVNAGSASLYISGDGSVTQGKNVTVHVTLGNISEVEGGVVGLSGNINYDSGKLSLVSGSCTHSTTLNTSNMRFNGAFPTSPITSTTNICTLTFTANATGSASVSISDVKISDAAAHPVSASGGSKSINIKEPPSSNNNLVSLSVSPGSIGFNGGTSYSTEVGASTTSVNVSGQVQDSKASVSGLGSHNLNYGSNKINVTVTAEDGSKKTYTINVIRKDDRSTNNNISSLKISNGTLRPGFSKGVLDYAMDVPFSVSKLNISCTPEDPKAKCSVHNNDLVAEKTTKVTVVCTAENGNSRTYNINVKRGKDPNKILSKDNNLVSLLVDQGILSPAFDMNKTNYVVYLPFEISNIDVGYQVSDTEYATVKVKRPESLAVGSNTITLDVTAEDESVKTYTITVYRGKSLDDANLSTNSNLKSIKLKKGSLTSKFEKNTYIYKYTGKPKVEAIAEDDKASINIDKNHKVYVITVTAESGSTSVYVLIPEEFNYLIIVVIALAVLSLILLIIVIKKKKDTTTINNENRKSVKK